MKASLDNQEQRGSAIIAEINALEAQLAERFAANGAKAEGIGNNLDAKLAENDAKIAQLDIERGKLIDGLKTYVDEHRSIVDTVEADQAASKPSCAARSRPGRTIFRQRCRRRSRLEASRVSNSRRP